MSTPTFKQRIGAALAAWRGQVEAPAHPEAQAQPAERVAEAAGAFDEEDKGWRTLTGQARRDLSPLAQEQMQKLAGYLWESNQVANRLIELPLAYLLAEGVTLICADPEHQQWINAWWHDPINRMPIRLPTFARELALFGEQCLPVYVNEVNGHVRLGYLDPSQIAEVINDPGNAAMEIGIRTKRDAAGQVLQFRVVVRGEDDELFAAAARTARAAFTSGDAFYFAVNKYAAGRRGRSDLMAAMDMLDAYDEFIFEQMERAGELDAFIWDVKLTGADETTVKNRAKDITKPSRGSVRVHNEQEEWKAEAPDLKAADRSESARLFRNHLLGGASVPEHFYGGGGDVNRSTGDSMSDPFFKIATMRQNFLRHMLQEMALYVLWQRAKAEGQTPDWGDPAWQVQVQFAEMVTRDVTKLAAALQGTVNAVGAAIAERLITRKTGLAIIAAAAKRLDVEIDPEAELAAVEEENPEPQPGEADPAGMQVPNLDAGQDGSADVDPNAKPSARAA